MRKLVSTHLFRHKRLQGAHLDQLLAAGVNGVELFCARQSFDYRDREQTAAIGGWFADHPMELHSMHSPIYADEREGRSGEPAINLADADPRRRLLAMDEAQRALEFSERVPFRYLVQHLGPSRDEWDERKADRALTSLERLRVLAKPAGVSVLVENIPNGLSTPEKLIGFLQRNHLDDIGICFDSGHAHLAAELFGGGGAAASWEILKTRVRSTHLHDNGGEKDEHLWPGEGSIDWSALMPHLNAVPWLLEVGDHAGNGDVVSRIRKTFDQLEQWSSVSA